jgi:hypothetical protein
MRLRRYEPHPIWYSKTLRRLSIFWCVLVGFPVIIYLLNRVSAYLLVFAAGFGALLLIYWAIWSLANRWK